MKTKKPDTIAEKNIKNLTSLWRTASMPSGTYYDGDLFDYSETPGSDWPHRLWLNRDFNSREEVQSVIEQLSSSSKKLVIPYWDIYNSDSFRYLEENGCTESSKLIGMSLKLTSPFKVRNRLNLKRVSNKEEATLWADIFPQAFGYYIGKNILWDTLNKVHYYVAYHQDEPIGTAIKFDTGNIAGIHAVGVIPEMRRKGFAEEIMRVILNKAIEADADHATLQASDMGKGLYLKLGFEEQFVIKHYALQV